jgi:hypothetical protein
MFEEWKADHSTMDSDDSDEAFEQFLFQLDTVNHTELYCIAEMIKEGYSLEDEKFMVDEAEDEKDDPLAMMMQLAVKPAANKSPAEVDCKFGAACNRPDCWFRHSKSTVAEPVAAAPAASSKPCHFGNTCRRTDCWFVHPRDAEPVAEPVAEHVAAAPAASSKPCKFGNNCRRRKGCWFAHPRDASGAGSA